ncbi:hypothetical protein [Oryza sativa Japonica Group]|uniref:Uncharacterized protein n=1 Tax=Oryza sativa subsp. japonica TaxID=39947 RepID=Q5N9R3_ORYSJ|nr:hypothetical protein [Oryza sativa Japonica Group]
MATSVRWTATSFSVTGGYGADGYRNYGRCNGVPRQPATIKPIARARGAVARDVTIRIATDVVANADGSRRYGQRVQCNYSTTTGRFSGRFEAGPPERGEKIEAANVLRTRNGG